MPKESKYEILEKRIVEAQSRLRKEDPNNPLLSLVEVTDMGVEWTAECGARYYGMTAYDGLMKYINDLKDSIKQLTIFSEA